MAEGVAKLSPISFLDCNSDVVLLHLLTADRLHLFAKMLSGAGGMMMTASLTVVPLSSYIIFLFFPPYSFVFLFLDNL